MRSDLRRWPSLAGQKPLRTGHPCPAL